MIRLRFRLWLAGVTAALATGCGGNGCNCVEPIPGGFPPEARIGNAVQVRVTPTGLDAIAADPAGLVAALVGSDSLTFDVPPACGEGDNPAICCEPIDGPVVDPCGPVAIDLDRRPGDAPRLELHPVDGGSRIDVVVRARVHTVTDLAIWYESGFISANCDVELNTEKSGAPDLLVTTSIDLAEHPTAGTTEIRVADVQIAQLDNGDIDLKGGFSCTLADLLIGFFKDTLTSGIADVLRKQIEGALCKACPGGTVDECGPFADACEDQVCMSGGECLQELGVSGRLLASALGLAGSGALDIYAVGGGYSDTDGGGLSLGVLGGARGGAAAARCGPPADPPAQPAIARSAFFSGNQRPDTGGAFDVAVGVHRQELDALAWGAYDGGLLCLSMGTPTISLLTSDTLGVLMPSLVDLLHGEPGQIYLGLRPQQPPAIALGAGTFTPDGEVDEPLLDVTFSNLDIDFFAMVDDQFIRVMTVTADVHLPLGVEVTADGQLQPVLGDVEDAFSNITVSNSRALLETPQELADRLPAVLSIALPFLGDALGAFALPEIGNLRLAIQPDGVTSVDSGQFLAIFADLEPASAPAPAPVDTSAEIVAVHVPPRAVYYAPRLARADRPAVELSLGGGRPDGTRADLEWQFRVDGGLWSPYTRSPRIALRRDVFWLPGTHRIEVRAREVGKPRTADPTPVVLAATIDTVPSLRAELVSQPDPRAVIGFHGRAGSSGCNCRVGRTSDPRSSAAVAALFAAAVLVLRRRRRRGRPPIAAIAALLALSGPPGCSCNGNDTPSCGDDECADGQVEPGPIGRWSDLATDGSRTVLSAYEETLGDLVVVDVDGDELVPTVVDGVPADAAPTYAPNTYRGGVVEPGDDVGAWTSIALRDGLAHVAYQDRTHGALKYARELGDGDWSIHTVDADGGQVGLYASLALQPSGAPAIAYLAIGIDDGAGGRRAQLRLARASSADPSGPGDWTIDTVEDVPVPCTGLCGTGEVCVTASMTCAPVDASCTEDCGSGSECVAGACTAISTFPAHDLPEGSGLFANLVVAGGDLAIVFYDRTAGDLVVARATGSGFERAVIDGDGGDRGMWASAVADGDTIHVAYQDALADRLLYTTWSAAGGAGAIEVVDDGTREGDRPHAVGAGAALALDGAGRPAVVYQDGTDIALRFARRDAGGAWQHAVLLDGAELFGFYNRAVREGDAIRVSTYAYDRAVYPPGELRLTRLP